MPIARIEEGIEEIRAGRIVILVDEDAPESDGFFCQAAQKVTAQSINYMLHHGRGILYVTLTDERIRELGIPMVAEENSRLAGLLCETQYSFSTDPQLRGAPAGHVINIREVRLAAGAEFVVMVCGDIMTMPGLPKVPSAEKIDLTDDGKVVGLF